MAVVKPEFNKYHLICTPVFTSFKPPSTQSEVSRMRGEAVPARMCHGKIFGIEVTSAIEHKYFPIEDISAQVYTKMAAKQRQNCEENLEEQLAKIDPATFAVFRAINYL